MKKIIVLFFAISFCHYTHVIASDDFSADTAGWSVITPAKLKQSLHDAPASVTVITQQKIRDLGIRSVAEALRLVPGMAVGVTSMNDYQLAYLSASILANRRINVLIDGMSNYRPGYSRVDWVSIPVHINDIERIEITRSPSASVYGANSFEAVVNIITILPINQQGSVIEGYVGSLSTRDGYLGYGATYGTTSFHLTLSKQSNNGYDKRANDTDNRDETDLDSVNFRGVTEINNGTLDYAFSGVNGVLTLDNTDPGRVSSSDQYIKDLAVSMNYTLDVSDRNSLKIHLDTMRGDHAEEWKSCYPAILFTDEMRAMFLANSSYAEALLAGQMPSGGTANDDVLAIAVLTRSATMTNPTYLTNVCGQINENFMEQKSVLSIEDTHVFTDDLRAVFGLGVNYNKGVSGTYLNGEITDAKYFAFVNMEYSFSDFVLNAGLMAEKEEERLRSNVYSPRLALNYHVTSTDTLRAVLSKAYRTPDMFEQSAYWNYTMTGITPPLDGVTTEALFYYSADGAGNLISEEILAKEFGYYGVFPSIKATLDIKLFHLDLKNLISDDDQFYNFHLNNNTTAKRDGGEFEFHIQSLDDMSHSLGYSYLNCESTHPYENQNLCAKHSGFANTTYEINENWNTSVAYYASTNISAFPFHRLDWVIGYINNSESYDFNASFIIRHYGEDGGYTLNQSTMKTNKFDKNTQFFFEIGIKY